MFVSVLSCFVCISDFFFWNESLLSCKKKKDWVLMNIVRGHMHISHLLTQNPSATKHHLPTRHIRALKPCFHRKERHEEYSGSGMELQLNVENGFHLLPRKMKSDPFLQLRSTPRNTSKHTLQAARENLSTQ